MSKEKINEQFDSKNVNSKVKSKNPNIKKILSLLDLEEVDETEKTTDNNIDKSEIKKNKEEITKVIIKTVDINSINNEENFNESHQTNFKLDNITDEEIKNLEKQQLINITDEDFQYSFNSGEDVNGEQGYQIEEINKNSINENSLKSEKNYDNKKGLPVYKKENKNDTKSESDIIENNIITHSKKLQNYSKKNWKSLNEEIPSVKLGKQIKENKELEYNIDTKYITGYDETELIDNPGKKYFKNIEFQGKKFMKYTKTKDIIKYNRVYYYCKNHRTSKLSDQLDNKENKKRINLCNAKIKYDIIKNLYSFFGQHSEECESTFKSEILNKAEIDVEINNYEEFRESLKNYLKN